MSVCKQCGGEVRWVLDGKWQCFNPDGSIHWDMCSKRRWEQVKATGERFETENTSGYADSIHGTKFDMISSGVQSSGHRFVTHTCGKPAWEECECS